MIRDGEQLGRYRVVKRLGQGGMADVYLAQMAGPAGVVKLVVLKVIREGSHGSAHFRSMFIDEARISMQLRHGNIVPVFDFGEIEGRYYIAMEYVDGVTVSRVMRACHAAARQLPATLALHVIAEVCKGLHHAHHMTGPDGRPLRIVHRDVSPQNVMVSFEGEVKLLDFGVARAAHRLSRTAIGEIKGKLRYMSPEQLQGLPVDARSDLYSSGLLLYWLLTNQRPFADHDNLAGLVAEMASCEVLPPSRLNRELPEALDPVVLRALARSPADRYPDAAAFGTAISTELYQLDPPYLPGALAGFVRELVVDPTLQEPLGRTFEHHLMQQITEDSGGTPVLPCAEPPATDPSPAPFEAAPTEPDEPAGGSAARPSLFTAETLLLDHAHQGEQRRARLLTPLLLGLAAAGVVAAVWMLTAPGSGGRAAERSPVSPATAPATGEPAAASTAAAGAGPFPGQVPARDAAPEPQSIPEVATGEDAGPAHARDAGVAGARPRERAPRRSRVRQPHQPAAEARVHVNADPWADVYWRGKKLGNTPLLDLKLPAGKHVLRFVNPELGREKQVELTLGAGDSKRIIVRMNE